ncbi:hypothetical protein Tco_0591516 [Tanacetum coccineum]
MEPNSVTIAYRFEITLQLCLFNRSKPKNNDELQPRLSNFFKNFDFNGGDDLCYQGGLDQRCHTQPPLPLSPSREMLMNDINQLQDLSNLLAMHLSQRNTPSSPYSPNLPHTLNMDQVEQHVGYYPCCIFTQKQFLTLSEDINWIELLLTRPQPPPQIQRDYPPTTTSALNSPSTTN